MRHIMRYSRAIVKFLKKKRSKYFLSLEASLFCFSFLQYFFGREKNNRLIFGCKFHKNFTVQGTMATNVKFLCVKLKHRTCKSCLSCQTVHIFLPFFLYTYIFFCFFCFFFSRRCDLGVFDVCASKK